MQLDLATNATGYIQNMNTHMVGKDAKQSNSWLTPSLLSSNRFDRDRMAPTNNPPILNVSSSVDSNKQLTQVEVKEDGMKLIKRVILLLNVFGMIVCTLLLINRSTICINKYVSYTPVNQYGGGGVV